MILVASRRKKLEADATPHKISKFRKIVGSGVPGRFKVSEGIAPICNGDFFPKKILTHDELVKKDLLFEKEASYVVKADDAHTFTQFSGAQIDPECITGIKYVCTEVEGKIYIAGEFVTESMSSYQENDFIETIKIDMVNTYGLIHVAVLNGVEIIDFNEETGIFTYVAASIERKYEH